MFRKKNTAPTTVAEAIAPFRAVKDGLVDVINRHVERRRVAQKRIEDAQNYAAEVAKVENAATDAATAEIEAAERIAKALSTLLEDDYEPVSVEAKLAEMKPNERIDYARENGLSSEEKLRPGSTGVVDTGK